MADDGEIIQPPNNLKSKVSTGGPGAVDLDAIARAEQAIANLAGDYVNWAKEDLAKLDAAYAELKASDGTDNKAQLDLIFHIAHDMKGQGGSFGYDLMTAIGDKLCRLVEKIEKASAREIDMVRVYTDAMRVVINHELKGDGGAEGKQLLMGLELVIKKA